MGTHAVASQVTIGTFQHCIAIVVIVPVCMSGSVVTFFTYSLIYPS